MTEGAARLFTHIRAIAARPVSPDMGSPDPFLRSAVATDLIDRYVEMEALMARARASGAQPPADVVELLEVAVARKHEAVCVRAAAEVRIATIAAGSRHVVDGIDRLELYSNTCARKAHRVYSALRNWESPLDQLPREQLVPLVRHLIASASATGIEPPEDVLAIVQRVEDGV